MHPCDDTETKKIFACRIERKVSSSLFDQGITRLCLCAVLSKLKSFLNFRRFIMANVNTDWVTVFCTEIQLSVNHFCYSVVERSLCQSSRLFGQFHIEFGISGWPLPVPIFGTGSILYVKDVPIFNPIGFCVDSADCFHCHHFGNGIWTFPIEANWIWPKYFSFSDCVTAFPWNKDVDVFKFSFVNCFILRWRIYSVRLWSVLHIL